MSKVVAFPSVRYRSYPTCGALALAPDYESPEPPRTKVSKRLAEIIPFPGAYNADGRLIRRKSNTETRKYVWDIPSENILLELDANNNVIASYIPTRTQDDIIVKQSGTQTSIYSDFAFFGG